MKLGDILEYVGWCQPIAIVHNDDVLYEGGCADRPFTWDDKELEMFTDDGIAAVQDTLVFRVEEA